MPRALAPTTLEKYSKILARTTGLGPFDINRLPNSQKRMLRAAVRWREANGGPPAEPTLRVSEPTYEIRRAVEMPDENDALAYEQAADRLSWPPDRAVALLPLRLGLRAAEVCSLTREAVQKAIKTGQLKATVKGGRERFIPSGKVTDLLQVLLDTPKKGAPFRIEEKARAKVSRWETVGEIFSNGQGNAQYRALWRVVVLVGKRAGWAKSRPHLLRHAFGTRMNRDGASLSTIQAALGHASVQTTQRYVHPSSADVAKYMR